MAATRRAIDAPKAAGAPAPPRRLSQAMDGDHAISSPARALQAALADAYSTAGGLPEPVVEKWPLRTRGLVLVGAACAAWGVVIVGVSFLGQVWR